MKEKLAKLIDVKSIMTLVLTVVFCVLALRGVVSGQEFLTIFTVIVGFYFGTQAQKKTNTTTYTGPQQGDGETLAEMPVSGKTGTEVHPEASMDTLQPPEYGI